jgi:hypothetical protein
MKFKATIKLGILISPFALIMEKRWTFDNSVGCFNPIIAMRSVTVWDGKTFVDQKDFKWSKKFNGFNDENRVGVTCGLFEGLNIAVHKESIVQDYLTTVTRLIVFYIHGSRLKLSILSNGKFTASGWIVEIFSIKFGQKI